MPGRSADVLPAGVLSPSSPRDEDCPICLVPLLEGGVVTPCGHRFHSSCIAAHVRAAASRCDAVIRCPTCRGVLVASGRTVAHPHRRYLHTPTQPRGASTRTLCGVAFDVHSTAEENVLVTALLVGGNCGRLLVFTPRACEPQRAAGTDWRRWVRVRAAPDTPASWDAATALAFEQPVPVLSGRQRGFIVLGLRPDAIAISASFPREVVATDGSIMLVSGRG